MLKNSETGGTLVHESQSPKSVRRELLASLARRRLNHKFLYDSPGQAKRWLALHEAYSPARKDPGCLAAYDEAFACVARQLAGRTLDVIGLGCGGGQKDARLLQLLVGAGASPSYTAVDVSPSLVERACETTSSACGGKVRLRRAVVCDLGQVRDLAKLLDLREAVGQASTGPMRLTTFFGMIPNFEPGLILPLLSGLVVDGQHELLFSANLAPGSNYEEGVKQVLPLYDNVLTREWLMGFLNEIGISSEDGLLEFVVETEPRHGLKRIAAYFTFRRQGRAQVGDVVVPFTSNERLRVFFSYRHTPEVIARLLDDYGLQVRQQWLAASGEEGVFLVQPAAL